MANDIGSDINPQYDVQEDVVVDDNDDVEVLREKLNKVSEQNKQLFARTKKAEGFELKDGQWIKPQKETPKEIPTVENKPSSKEPSTDLDFGQLAFYNTKSDVVRIEAEDDVEFLKQTMAETGKSQQAILQSQWFQKELQEKAEARQSANAIPEGKNRSGQTGITDVDMAVAKFKETGELPQDFKTRVAVKNKLVESEQSKGMFTGPSVIGNEGSQF